MNGCPWGKNIVGAFDSFDEQAECHAAARGGHLAVL
jgi:hypothetical protein